MASKMNRRKKLRKHLGSFAIIGVVLLLLIFVSVASLSLRVTNGNKQERIAELESQIEAEEKKAEELEEYKKYVQTKKYAEEVAKEKLGLVYEDEIIFKAED
jgi:cell division protein DivIC